MAERRLLTLVIGGFNGAVQERDLDSQLACACSRTARRRNAHDSTPSSLSLAFPLRVDSDGLQVSQEQGVSMRLLLQPGGHVYSVHLLTLDYRILDASMYKYREQAPTTPFSTPLSTRLLSVGLVGNNCSFEIN